MSQAEVGSSAAGAEGTAAAAVVAKGSGGPPRSPTGLMGWDDAHRPASPPLAGGFIRDDDSDAGSEGGEREVKSTTPTKPPPDADPAPTTPPDSSQATASPASSPVAELRRVKVYELKGNAWLDRGTGHCEGFIEPGPPGPGALGLSGMGLGSPFACTGPPSPGTSGFEDTAADSIRGRRSRTVSGLGGEARIEVRKEATETTAGGELLLRSRVIRPSPTAIRRTRALGGEDDVNEDSSREEGSKRSSPSGGDDRPRKRMLLEWPEGGGIYQRQQDTLVVWTEPDGIDMALSFATPQGCQEMWRFLCDAQEMLGPPPEPARITIGVVPGGRRLGREQIHWDDEDAPRRLGSDDEDSLAFDLLSTSSPSSSPGLGGSALPGHHAALLPSEPSLSNIADADAALKLAARTALGREKASAALLKTSFVPKLEGVFKDAEDVESVGDLHGLCLLMQTILTLNDAVIYEHCVQDETVLGVASILEYDPEFGDHKASYRAHLADTTRFREVVPIRDATIRSKIHQTYRLQYFKDVILARILDDPTFSILNTMICFNQIDIATHLQGNEAFLKELFAIFQERPPSIGPTLPPHLATQSASEGDDSATSDQRKDDAMLFLQQLCSMAKHLQAGPRGGFYRSLCEHGLLTVLEKALARRELDPAIRSATCEVLVTVIDHDPNSVRSHCLKQHTGKKRTLVTFLIELLIEERDLGLKVQLVEAMRILVDAGGEAPRPEIGLLARKEEDPEAEKFLQFFYDNCVQQLVQPLAVLPDFSAVKERRLRFDSVQVALFNHLCDMVGFFVTHHTFRSKYFILSSTVSVKVATLLRTRYKHLRLAALRYFRACIGKNDDFYNRFLFKNDLFSPIVELAADEGAKDNLLASACLEFFEHLRLVNAKPVLNHLMDTNGTVLRKLSEVLPTFKLLVMKWEQNNEPPPKPSGDLKSEDLKRTQTINIGQWSRSSLDLDEDRYFNDSDSDDDSSPKPAGAQANGRDGGGHAQPKRSSSEGKDSPLFGLLEYGDDDSDDDGGRPIQVEEALPASTAPPASPSMQTSALPLESPRPTVSAPLTRTVSAAQLGNLSGEAPPTFKLGERRQREEEADDQLGLLGARMKREKIEHGSASPTIKLNGLGIAGKGGHHRKGTAQNSLPPSSTPPIGKIRLSLASSTANKLAQTSPAPSDSSKATSASPPLNPSQGGG